MRFIPETDVQVIRAHLDKKLDGPVTLEPRLRYLPTTARNEPLGCMNQWPPSSLPRILPQPWKRIPDVRFHEIRNSRGIAGSAAEAFRQPRHAAFDHASAESPHIDGSDLARRT